MSDITFVTGNDEKFQIAEATCMTHGVGLKRARLNIDEIQGEDAEVIALDKAQKAFEKLQAPVVINDDSWLFPGLNGFPGPYMKSMNHWLTPQDFLNLTRDLTDRRAIINQLMVYQDKDGMKIFRNEIVTTLLTETRGNYGVSIQKVVTMPSDNGLSIAEAYDRGKTDRGAEATAGWDQFAAWYAAEKL